MDLIVIAFETDRKRFSTWVSEITGYGYQSVYFNHRVEQLRDKRGRYASGYHRVFRSPRAIATSPYRKD